MAGVLEVLITMGENAPHILDTLPTGAETVPLERGLVLVPVTHALTAAIGDVEVGHLGFEELTTTLAGFAMASSHHAPVVYCHLEFHGGLGFQASVGWSRGSIDFGPLFTANHPTEQITQEYIVVEKGMCRLLWRSTSPCGISAWWQRGTSTSSTSSD